MKPEIAQRCDLFYRVLSDFVDGTLEEVDMAYVEEHLKLCPPCEVYLDQFRAVADANQRLQAKATTPEIDRVLQQVLAQWQAAKDHPA